MSGDLQHLFNCTFANQQLALLFILYHDRQATTYKIKRQLINLAVAPQRLNAWLALAKTDHRLIHQVLHAALMEAVQPG
ncbi:hypothetical protein D3C76_1485930 [compost metagenome]